MKNQIFDEGDLRAEYDLAPLLQNAVRGKYAERFREGTNLTQVATLPLQASDQ